MRKQRSVLAAVGSTVLEGLVIGVCATQALDWLSMLIYDNEDPALRAREDAVRGHLHAYERAVDRMAHLGGIALDCDAVGRWGWRFHKAFGILGGVTYAALRRWDRRIGWGVGLGFGAAFFLVVDEVLMPTLGLTPGPRAFSWKVHARGAASHIAYGLAAESAARAFDQHAGR